MSLHRQLSKGIGAAALLVVATFASTNAAQAGGRPFMIAGQSVAPPPGFVDLCRRDQTACGSDAAELALNAPQLISSPTTSIGGGSFSGNGLPKTVAAEASTLTGPAMLEAYRPEIDADFVDAGTFVERAPAAASTIMASTPAFGTSTKLELKLLNNINRQVNSDVHKATDFDLYGMIEYWSLPRVINGKMYGDCEDYALEKRKRLIEAGVPASKLSMAVAVTARGESHAVLVVSLASGDWVLDNLTPWATPWEELNYHWVQRQVADTNQWVAIS